MRNNSIECASPIAADATISVVIATLGGPTLVDTILALNRGRVVPDEILVCIPRSEASNIEHLSFSNLRIVVTECRGQVAQRAQGFLLAAGPLVMQMDDDMLPDADCLRRLRETLIEKGDQVAIAPVLINRATGHSVYRKPVKTEWMQCLYYWLVNGRDGYMPGRVDRAGNAVGIDPDDFPSQQVIETDWLPGGCVLHYKSNLICDEYFPFPGKAYGEDVMHSHLLAAKGIDLFVDTRARCEMDLLYGDIGRRAFWRNIYGDWRARKYTMVLLGRLSPRIVLIYIFAFIGYFGSQILKRDNS
jgi:hypothetical protein